ncbi:nucleotidyltransferase family protein [Candidatus Poriferisodalis sp.]|uniref:nucleotidyltransferase family protein n=1 Tax=Candidatus Poriferisodalis sp. TaxID=3101277 RepID=UPI003B5269B9
MSRRDVILDRHREAIRAVAAKHNASSIALAGSVARGADGPDSDCDFVCEFAPGTTVIDVIGLEMDLVEMLGCHVEVCSARALQAPYTSMLDDAIRL